MKLSPGEIWEFEGRHELESILNEHDLDKEDICLVGSMSLSVRGLREHGDIDFCVRSDKWDQIDSMSLDEDGFVGMTKERYSEIDLSDDELIENDAYHDIIDGFKVVRPEITFSYKKLRDLSKDERDVELLEQYSMSTDDWNWDLYRSDYSQRPNSNLSRGIQSLQSDGIIVTVDKVLGLAMRKFPLVRRTIGSLPVFDPRTPYETVRGKTRSLSPAQLLNRQYVGDQFAGLDVVAYWTALEAEEQGDFPEFDPTKLETDIETLANTPLDNLEPVHLTQRHRILEPERVARLIHEGQDEFEVAFLFSRNRGGDTAWLEEHGFTPREVSTIQEQRLKLLERMGMLFYVICWPLTHEYHDEMEKELKRRVTVVDSEDKEISDIEGFVHDTYNAQTDISPDWAINWKAELMTKYPNTVRVLKIELPNPRLHDGISREMEMVKNDVRHAFIDEFPDEYYLSLLHATDSFKDNLKAKEVIESHS